MYKNLIFCSGVGPASKYMKKYLENHGFQIATVPEKEVSHLILDVPSFNEFGIMPSGKRIKDILHDLPDNITVCGGNLNHDSLENYQVIDLLKDPQYLAQNAYLTAEATLKILLSQLSCSLRECTVLILGYGRIGKALCKLMSSIGSHVTVAVRNDTDRAMINALGINAIDFQSANRYYVNYNIVINTVPSPVLYVKEMNHEQIMIDLASKRGIEGDNVIIARGIPGIYLAESTGVLAAKRFLDLSNLIKEADR